MFIFFDTSPSRRRYGSHGLRVLRESPQSPGRRLKGPAQPQPWRPATACTQWLPRGHVGMLGVGAAGEGSWDHLLPHSEKTLRCILGTEFGRLAHASCNKPQVMKQDWILHVSLSVGLGVYLPITCHIRTTGSYCGSKQRRDTRVRAEMGCTQSLCFDGCLAVTWLV